MPDESVQLVVSSPPYSVGKDYEKGRGLAENLVFQDRVLTECRRVLKPSGSICWQVGNAVERTINSVGIEVSEQVPLDVMLYKVFASLGFKLRNRIIWTYDHGMHSKHKFSLRHETILWYTKTDDYFFNLDAVRVPQKFPNKRAYKGPRKGQLSGHPMGKNPGDVWNITNVKNGHPEKVEIHPCQFPLTLVDRLVRSLSLKDDLVLDPFGGVATTLLAALQNGRVPLSAEINPEYHLHGLKRIQAHFGKPETRASKGNGSLKYYILPKSAQKLISQ